MKTKATMQQMRRTLRLMMQSCEMRDPTWKILGNVRADDAAEALQYASSLIRSKREVSKLQSFAQEIMQAWPEGGIEGDDLQRIAVRHGLLTPQIRHEPCGEACLCAEVLDPSDWEAGARCYGKTTLLTGE